MTARIFIKLILAVTGVLAVALTSVNLIATPRVRASLLESLESELREKARGLELLLPREPDEFKTIGERVDARITWIAPDGKVLADSEADPARMDNHANRPEVVQAFAGRTGKSLRLSPTVGIDFFYVAIPVSNPSPGSVLRLAVSAEAVNRHVTDLRNAVLFATTLAFIPAVLLAAWFARRASNRLGAIIEFTKGLTESNFSSRLGDTSRGELGVLAAHLNETGEKLQFMMDRIETEHSELERVERIRKDFVINVSHELRTPLASIQGYTETLLDGAVEQPELARKFLNIIRQNAERLTRLSADLLVLSRVELGQQVFKFAAHPVNRLLGDNADSMLPLAQQKKVSLQLESAPDGAQVFCDTEAVHQILTNLVENAIKYTPEGGSVTLGARATGSEQYEFFVRDTGSGIPPDDLSRLFERFYRVDKARSKALGGTGLGLAIVKHLTLSQGGSVRVESKLGAGSTFYFTLPTRDLGFPEAGAVQQEFMAP